MEDSVQTFFLCGDVMTGRGIDQILPTPSDPALFEPYVTDARDYVNLAARCHGPIDWPTSFEHIWGDALRELAQSRPKLRLVNLETSITTAARPWPGKCVHYRMHPNNVQCLRAAGIDVCALSNNHTLDWGRQGLAETLATLRDANIACAGAGRTLAKAKQPAIVTLANGHRVLVFSCALASSGIPETWAAADNGSGLFLLPGLDARSLDILRDQIQAWKKPGDMVILSIHWGSNWGYELASGQRTFAHRLVAETGVDLVHGHSSHHPRGSEVHRGKLILYGCGDFINDYEGIGGHQGYRDDLRLMYFPTCDLNTGRLVNLTVVPLQMFRFRLRRAGKADTRWLAATLNAVFPAPEHSYRVEPDGTLSLQFPGIG